MGARRPVNVAIVGAGPAGLYLAILLKREAPGPGARGQGTERLRPVPFDAVVFDIGGTLVHEDDGMHVVEYVVLLRKDEPPEGLTAALCLCGAWPALSTPPVR